MNNEHEIASAKRLLERTPSDDYLDEWTTLLQNEKKIEEPKKENSVVIFRLFHEWLAFPTLLFTELAQLRKIHSVPHSNDKILLGLVNLRGQLKLTIALHHLLQIDATANDFTRMLSIRKNGEQWIFPVSEVYGIYRYDVNQLQNVPITITKSTANFLKGLIPWAENNVGLIDDELLFSSLRRIGL